VSCNINALPHQVPQVALEAALEKKSRRTLPSRRHHITQKVKIAGRRTLYISVHDHEHPAEIFLRVKGADCSSELIGLYDVIARLMSIALQHGASAREAR
jgi:hypothetical protein